MNIQLLTGKQQERKTYRLTAIINYVRFNNHSGHYMAYVRCSQFNNQWFFFDDSKVRNKLH